MTNQSIADSQMILALLDQLCENQTPVSITQNENLVWGVIKDVNVYSKKIALRPLDIEHGFAIDPNLAVTIASKNGNLLFESSVTNFLKRNLAIFRFPDEIIIENPRQSPRFYFDENNYPVHCSNFTLVDYSMDTLNWKASLCDISETGLALQSEDPKAKRFKIGDTLIFTFINTYAVPQKLSGEIIYIHSIHHKYKMGIKFEYPIPIYDVLEHLKAKNDD